MPEDPLAQLRDIHLPEAISWWPPAPGWLLLAALVLALLLFAVGKWLKTWRDNNYRRQAQSELDSAWKQFKTNHDAQAYLKLCNIVLRRAALHRDSVNRRAIAPLAGQEWFDYLDSCCSKPVFAGHVDPDMADAHYRPVDDQQAQEQTRALHRAALKWVKAHP